MTNEQILKKAIEKAVRRGFKFEHNLQATQYNFYYYADIFSHDFVKAFWGEELVCDMCGKKEFSGSTDCIDWCKCITPSGSSSVSQPNWQYHLQQMVLEKEPLKYLKKFL